MKTALVKFYFCILAVIITSTSAFADPQPILVMYSEGGHRAAAMSILERLRSTHPTEAIVELDLTTLLRDLPQGATEEHWRYLQRILPTVSSEPRLSQLQQRIADINPKMILTTDYPFAQAMGQLRHSGRLNVPVGWVHVDLVSDSTYARVAQLVDHTFVGSAEILDGLATQGVPRENMTVTGFPVRDLFLHGQSLPRSAVPTITLTGGSWGLFEAFETVMSLDMAARSPVRVIAITGRNSTEAQRLHDLILSGRLRHVQLQVEGLIPQDQLLNVVRSSDLVISKPGGATIFEMAFADTAVLYVNHMSAPHEQLNMEYAVSRGAAASITGYVGIGQRALEIVSSPSVRQAQLDAQARWRGALNFSAITEWVMGDPQGIICGGKFKPE